MTLLGKHLYLVVYWSLVLAEPLFDVCPQETYLMKHMSKHTVVEHLVSHHSPQRTESPSIPIRISLIWALRPDTHGGTPCKVTPPLKRNQSQILAFICLFVYPMWVSKMCQTVFVPYQEVDFFFLSSIWCGWIMFGTSKDDFTALSGLIVLAKKVFSLLRQ